MAIKLVKDQIFASRTAFLSAAEEARQHFSTIGVDFWDILHDTFPVIIDPETNETLATLNPDEAGTPFLADNVDLGRLAIVTIYSDKSIPQPEGDAVAVPSAIYCLSLPKFDEIKTDPKLASILSAILDKALLASARKIAKAHAADATANPLTRDRIASLIASQTTRGGDPVAKAFKALFPTLQAVILAQVDKAVATLKSANRHADARLMAATFNRQRLNSQTLFECLSSTDAAKMHFPNMGQTQWQNLLQFAIKYAPQHKIRVAQRAEDGRTTLKDAEGKTIYTENVPFPVSPVPFSSMLETRDAETLAPTNAPELVFTDLTA